MFICKIVIVIFKIKIMEKKETTKVGCQSCKSNKGVERTQKFLYVLGFIMFGLSIYGGIRLVKDLSSLF